jgi:hypothetical protein
LQCLMLVITVETNHDWQGATRGGGEATTSWCLDGSARAVRPRRARCRGCRATRVLLPSWCQPRLADATEVVGTALCQRRLKIDPLATPEN